VALFVPVIFSALGLSVGVRDVYGGRAHGPIILSQCHSFPSPSFFDTCKLWPNLISMATTSIANLLPAHFETAISAVGVGLVYGYTVTSKFQRCSCQSSGGSSPTLRGVQK